MQFNSNTYSFQNGHEVKTTYLKKTGLIDGWWSRLHWLINCLLVSAVMRALVCCHLNHRLVYYSLNMDEACMVTLEMTGLNNILLSLRNLVRDCFTL